MKGFVSGAEVSTSFHLWNKNRRAMNRADSGDLNLLSNIAGEETKPWFDPVYRSLVLHDKMLFEEENERSESGAEVSTLFHLWNKNRRAMNRADSLIDEFAIWKSLRR